MEGLEFVWDEWNTKHLFTDHHDRKLSIEEIESTFSDKLKEVKFDKINRFGESDFLCVGTSNQNRILCVWFNVRNGYIRPFSCRVDRKLRKEYERKNKNT